MPWKLQWIEAFQVGEECHHWWSKREGIVVETAPGSWMTIEFKDGAVEVRRKAAFEKGEAPVQYSFKKV
jgi:hypothetical protein